MNADWRSVQQHGLGWPTSASKVLEWGHPRTWRCAVCQAGGQQASGRCALAAARRGGHGGGAVGLTAAGGTAGRARLARKCTPHCNTGHPARGAGDGKCQGLSESSISSRSLRPNTQKPCNTGHPARGAGHRQCQFKHKLAPNHTETMCHENAHTRQTHAETGASPPLGSAD